MIQSNNELENLFTYRFIQVLYVIGLILSFCFVIVLALILCPEKHLNVEKSTLTCSDGKSYTFHNIGIEDPWNQYSRYFWQSDTPKLLDNDKQQLDIQCVDSLTDSFLKYKFTNQNSIIDLNRLPKDELLVLNKIIYLETIIELKSRGLSMPDSNPDPLFNLSSNNLNEMIIEKKKTLMNRSIKDLLFIYNAPQRIWLWFVVLLLLLPTCLYAFLNILRETLIYLFIGRKFTWQWLKFYKKIAL